MQFETPKDAHEDVKKVTPVIGPGIHLNAVDGFESALLVKGLADIVIPQHEPSFLEIESIP